MEIIINKKVYIRLIMSYCTLGLKMLDIAWSSVGRKWIYITFRLIFSKIHLTSTLILNNSVVVNSPSPEESESSTIQGVSLVSSSSWMKPECKIKFIRFVKPEIYVQMIEK